MFFIFNFQASFLHSSLNWVPRPVFGLTHSIIFNTWWQCLQIDSFVKISGNLFISIMQRITVDELNSWGRILNIFVRWCNSFCLQPRIFGEWHWITAFIFACFSVFHKPAMSSIFLFIQSFSAELKSFEFLFSLSFLNESNGLFLYFEEMLQFIL